MSTTSADAATVPWRPTPWIAAVLGLVGGGLGLLYVQRPWYAIAYLAAAIGAGLALLAAAIAFDRGMPLDATPWVSWVVRIACAVHAYRIANAGSSVAERRWYSRWYGLVAYLVLIAAFAFLFRAFFYEPFRTPAESMQPSIPKGSYLFVSKAGFGRYSGFGITIWRGSPSVTIARGDIVAHHPVQDPGLTYVTRIVGLPGDRIEYANRRLVINGNTMPLRFTSREGPYQYALERIDGKEVTIALLPQRPSRDWAGVVPPNHYFVLGDNRDNSRDSRYAGFVPRDQVIGRVIKILPPDKQ